MPQHAIEIDHHGMTLRGTAHVPVGSKRFPTVMMLHGFTGQRIESGFLYVHLARAMEAIGIAVVRFDFMHSGESDGSFEQMLVTGEVADALRVTEWMGSQPYVDRSRLGVIGFSLGGLVAGCVTGRSDAFKSRVLIAPTTSTNMNQFNKKNVDANGKVAVGPHTLHPDFFNDVMALDTAHEAAQRVMPTLLIQGTGDTAVTPAVSQAFIDAMVEAGAVGDLTPEHVLVPDADHGFSSPAWRRQLTDEVVGFMQRTL